jgi:hypothetical protein
MLRFLAIRVVTGIIEGILVVFLLNRLGSGNLNTYVLLGAAMISIAVSAITESKHYPSWSARHDLGGAIAYVVTTGMIGAPVVALAAYAALFVALASLMAP